MKILFVSSEIHPLIKTGGLADVSRSLPLALHQSGVDIRVLVPGYPPVMARLTEPCQVHPLAPELLRSPAQLLQTTLPGTSLPLLVLDCPALFDRPGPSPYQNPQGQDWWDNALRFGALSRMAQHLCSPHSRLTWSPDLLHCNDWQSALAPALLTLNGQPTFPTLLTVHNLAFQGNFDPLWLSRLGLPIQAFHPEALEFHGQLSFLKAGLRFAQRITTVSPRYAQEIQTAQFGCGLEGLLHQRRGDLTGILNGIDPEWHPATDPLIAHAYDLSNLAPKALNKEALQRHLGLRPEPQSLLVGMVTRLTHQKGIDLVLDRLEPMMHQPIQFAILGSGDSPIENRLREFSQRYPKRISVTLAFSEPLSHQIIAGSDLLLMPSRFEPCGLTQLYAMTYGTLPLVHRTGGLADTVLDDADPDQQSATGFCFDEPSADALWNTLLRALECHTRTARWQTLQANGMRRDSSWGHAAREYLSLYETLQERSITAR